jgi:hypothetical protein
MVGLIVGGPVQQVRYLAASFSRLPLAFNLSLQDKARSTEEIKVSTPRPRTESVRTQSVVYGGASFVNRNAFLCSAKSSRGGWSGLSFRGKGFPDAY